MWGSRSNDLQEFTAIVVMMECSIDSALAGMSNAIREKLTFGASGLYSKLGVILHRFCLLLDVVTEAEEMVNRYLTLLRSISQTIGWQTSLVQLLFESLPGTLNHTVTAWGILQMLQATLDLALVLLKLVFQDYSYWEDNDVLAFPDVPPKDTEKMEAKPENLSIIILLDFSFLIN